MTLSIELTPEEEARLRDAARIAGVDVAEWARRVVTEHLPSLSPGQATRDMLRSWQEADATDDPEEIRKANAELTAFKQAMNGTRHAVGARPLYQ
jgi:hypothetical protein